MQSTAPTQGSGTQGAGTTAPPAPTPQPSVTVNVSAQSTTISLGAQLPITWQSTNTTSCVGSASSIFAGFFDLAYGTTVNTTSGSLTVIPTGTGNFTYTVTCSGSTGPASASTSVTVAAIPGAPPITITAPVQGESVMLGQSVAVTWQGPAGFDCLVIVSPQDETGFNTSSGTVSVMPTAVGTVTYGVTCSNTSGLTSFAAAPAVTVTNANFLALATISAIGSTTDPMVHDMHPAGLALASTTSGAVTAGDLLVCNFSDSGGNAGQGTTVVGLHPGAGSTPYRVAQSSQLAGCNGLATLPDGTLFAAAYTANQTPMITTAGVVSAALPVGTFTQPSSIVSASGNTLYVAAIDLSRPDGGSIYRVTLVGDTPSVTGIVQIVSGFCTSGKPGALFGPVGLAYDSSTDTLYIADTSSGQVIAIGSVSGFSAAGQFFAGCGGPPPTTLTRIEGTPQEDSIRFYSPSSSSFTPVGMTILADGSLLVLNGDLPVSSAAAPPPAVNSAFQFLNPSGILAQVRQLDNGPSGALSGIVTTQDSQGNPVAYFTDANTNSVMVLSQ
jgi:hypothetical protein